MPRVDSIGRLDSAHKIVARYIPTTGWRAGKQVSEGEYQSCCCLACYYACTYVRTHMRASARSNLHGMHWKKEGVRGSIV